MEPLASYYRATLRSQLARELGIANLHAVPGLRKVTMNVGLNQARLDQKRIDHIERIMGVIAGQKPTIRRARKSVASFKLRAGEPVGIALTLRGKRMYDFIERLVRIVLPRVRDFRGINRKSFDGRGNLSIGIREMAVFPEIRYEDADLIHGIEITIVTTADSDEAANKLLTGLGFPLTGEMK